MDHSNNGKVEACYGLYLEIDDEKASAISAMRTAILNKTLKEETYGQETKEQRKENREER